MPRSRPEPEANKIQNPELIRSLQQGLGMRQMHTTPTVGSEITPVVIVRDLSTTAQAIPQTFSVFKDNQASAAGPLAWDLWNPPTHNRIVKVLRASVAPQHGGIINFATAALLTAPPVTGKRGTCISKGALGDDFASRAVTPVAVYALEGAVVGVATWYEQRIQDDQNVPPIGQLPPFEYEFNDLYLGPGSVLIMFTDTSPPLQMLGCFEWQEFPQT